MEIIQHNNDNTLQLDEVRDVDGTYDNGATVLADLVDEDGTSLIGSPLLSMAYVSGTNGRYRATLQDTLSWSKNRGYTALITATLSSGAKGYWEMPCRVVVRRGA